MSYRHRKIYKLVAAISFMFFVGLSFLQVSSITCCKKGQTCPINGVVSDLDNDGHSSFFDCFSKKQGKNKIGEEYSKKLKQAVSLSGAVTVPECSGYARVSWGTLSLYDDHFPGVPALPG